jgi:hypothetical protein
MTHNKPIHEICIGKIRAAIWANRNGKNQTWYSVTIRRTYFDGHTWQDSQSFGRDDLPLLAKASDMAYAWIWDRCATPTSDEPVKQ